MRILGARGAGGILPPLALVLASIPAIIFPREAGALSPASAQANGEVNLGRCMRQSATAESAGLLPFCLRGLPGPPSSLTEQSVGQGAVSARPQPPPGDERCVAPVFTDRCPVWAAAYDHVPGTEGGLSGDFATDSVADPRGRYIAITGHTWWDDESGLDTVTAAFDTTTGRQLWATRFHGEPSAGEFPLAMTTSSDGSRLYVTGYAWVERVDGGADAEIVTQAYEAETGALLWVARHDGPDGFDDFGYDVAASPDGRSVYVTGIQDFSFGAQPVTPSITLAYGAATGSTRWKATYTGGGSPDGLDLNANFSVGVSPDSRLVYVTGRTTGRTTNLVDIDWVTIAYEAEPGDPKGRVAWAARLDGAVHSMDQPVALAVDPAAGTVVVTGVTWTSYGDTGGTETIGYDGTSGATLWSDRWVPDDPGTSEWAVPASVTLDPSGIYVAAQSSVMASGVVINTHRTYDVSVLAYRLDGSRRWARTYTDHASISAPVAIASDGGQRLAVGAFVRPRQNANDAYWTFVPPQAALLSIDAASGALGWTARYDAPATPTGDHRPVGVHLDPSTGRAFLAETRLHDLADWWGYYTAGIVTGPTNASDYLLLAYDEDTSNAA